MDCLPLPNPPPSRLTRRGGQRHSPLKINSVAFPFFLRFFCFLRCFGFFGFLRLLWFLCYGLGDFLFDFLFHIVPHFWIVFNQLPHCISALPQFVAVIRKPRT